uniref:DNA repair and recombination protein RadA n=1 Tax=Thermofilum pendens TaxID=2269 RepID=A0A7J3X810_THEPE
MGRSVDELASVEGVGRVTISRLKSAGISYLEDLVAFNPEELEELAGIDYERAVKVIRAARQLLGWSARIYKGREYAEALARREALTTGVRALDELLGGGLVVYDIYEFAGEFGSGKTQLCHQLAVTAQLPPARGGLGGDVVYIDTEGTFSPERMERIAQRFDVEDPLSRVYVARPINVDEMEEVVVRNLAPLLREGVRLVVVDSIIALYRAEFKGREWLAARQQRINYLLDWLKRLARVHEAVVVITNQVVAVPSAWGVTIKLPAGGNIIAHASTHRFLLKKAGDVWTAECLDSPRIARGTSASFLIAEDGLRDVK